MLGNAHNFPAPAMWLGVMLCLLPLFFWVSTKVDTGRGFALLSVAYFATGSAITYGLLEMMA